MSDEADDLRAAYRRGSAASRSVAGFGHQIRSYVLAPYRMVKDLRTAVVSGDPEAVLDGDLDAFLTKSLEMRIDHPRRFRVVPD